MSRKPIRPTTLSFLAVFACLAGGCKPSAQSASSSGKTSSFQKKWEFTLGGKTESALALSDDGILIAACEDGYVYAVDSNGTLQWKTYIGPTLSSPAIGSDGAIYIANNNGSVFALNRSGSKRWTSIVYPGSTYGHNAAAIGDGFLYTPSRDGLKALSLSDGRVDWSAGIGTSQWGAVTLLMDGTILFGSRGRLLAVNTHGETLWQYPALSAEATARNGGLPPPGSFNVVTGVTPGPDRLLLVGEGRDHLSAVGQDATLHWDFKSTGNNLNTSSPLIAADGVILLTPTTTCTPSIPSARKSGLWTCTTMTHPVPCWLPTARSLWLVGATFTLSRPPEKFFRRLTSVVPSSLRPRSRPTAPSFS